MSSHNASGVFRAIIVSTGTLIVLLPSAIVGLGGMVAASQACGFDKLKPNLHENLTWFTNSLLAFAIEHWILYIVVSVGLGLFWALVVTEPKTASKRNFQSRRRKRIGEG